MTRQQLEHIIRAAGSIVGASEIIIVGSQAILGQFPAAPNPLNLSNDADLFTLRDPADALLIEGSIGEESPFHRTFGYHAHGIDRTTVVLPDGWQSRLVPVHGPATAGVTGLCLEANDLAVFKLVAGREKDIVFIAAMHRHAFIQPEVVQQRLATTPIDDDARARCLRRLDNIIADRT